jgi:DMSO reductase family type II enzyme heme b subunit
MRVRYVAGFDSETILDPGSRVWQGARTERVDLIGTPLGLQPTAAIIVAWVGKKIGVTERVEVAAVHDGQALAFRLEWGDAVENASLEDTTSFVDGAAVLLPGTAGAPLPTMGAVGLFVNAWYWRADQDGSGRHVVAEGVATSRTVDTELVKGRGVWKDGRWQVVIARALRVRTSEPVAQLSPGDVTQFGVAVWEGSNRERGGIKAYSLDWRELLLDAAPSARR